MTDTGPLKCAQETKWYFGYNQYPAIPQFPTAATSEYIVSARDFENVLPAQFQIASPGRFQTAKNIILVHESSISGELKCLTYDAC